MFIDIHVHSSLNPLIWEGKARHATPQQLIERYDKLGIEKGVLLPGVGPDASYQLRPTEIILQICEMFPDRFIPFCNVDPRQLSNSPFSPLGKLLTYYKEKGCKGIGEVCANLPIISPMVQNLFKSAEELRMPLTFHLAPQIGDFYGLYDEVGLPGLDYSLGKFPDLIFLGHSQPFWAEIGELEKPGDRYGYPDYPVKKEGVLPKLMREHKNLYGDLSAGSGYNALARDIDHAISFLNEFQDRLFFGTDICAPDTPTPLVDFLIKLKEEDKISEVVFNKVARENAIKLLNIPAN